MSSTADVRSRAAGAWRWPLAAIGLVVLGLALPTAQAESLRFNAGLGGGYDDNVRLSENDKSDSAFTALSLSAERSFFFSPSWGLLARGSLLGEVMHEFEELSNAKARALLRGLYRPRGGFYAPLLAVWGSAARWEFDSEIRRSNEYRGGVFIAQPLTTRLNARLELAVSRRSAEGAVFDLSGQSAALSLSWMALERLSLNLGYEFQTGDTAPSADLNLHIVRAAERIEADDAFGGLADNQFAYRIDTDTHIVTTGLNWRLTRNWALDGQVQAIDAEGESGFGYERLIGVLSLLARF